MREAIVETIDLSKHFPARGGLLAGRGSPIRAVDGVSFTIERGETFALVGESGCGKTTTGELVLSLQRPTRGDVLFQGKSIKQASHGQMRALRKRMQVVFQNPRSSLDPRMRVNDILAEPFLAHGDPRARSREAGAELLRVVGLEPRLGSRFPHELSGGQAQRVAIARALALRPDFIVLDEPTSALDVSVQAQIINLLEDLQAQLGLTYLFISHDLRIVRHISDRIGVMYLGKILELGPTAGIYRSPRHPYTQALLSAIPRAHPRLRREQVILSGEVPDPAAIPCGCRFRTRCRLAAEICRAAQPELCGVAPGHRVACHLAASSGDASMGPPSTGLGESMRASTHES